MQKMYIVNLSFEEKVITHLYANDMVKEDKQIVIVADNIFEKDYTIEFFLKGDMVGFFKKEDVHSFYEHEVFKPNTLDTLLDEFILTWNGIINLGADSIKHIYQQGLGENSQYILNCLLTDICQETKHQYDKYDGNLICSRCFKKYERIDDYKENSLVYFGCPECKQTNRNYGNINTIVCLLDNQSQLGHYVKNKILYVNWLVVYKRFDFNSILIQNATDFDIERFVVHTQDEGLNTNKISLEANCYISDNSRKILSKYFDYK